jgi:WD40 repeat protein
LKAITEDAIRFSQSNVEIIQIAPLQIYSSALMFAPECSIIRQEFVKNVCQDIPLVFNRPNTWRTCVHTLIGHTGEITSLAFLPTSHLWSYSEWDGTIRIWGIETGNCQQILLIKKFCERLIISPDSKKVAASDTNVDIWNTDTGEKMHTLHTNRGYLQATVFASDSKLLASAYIPFDRNDKTVCICIWCTETGKLLQTLKCHSGQFSLASLGTKVAFSPDLRHVAAASQCTALIWDIETAEEMCNLPLQRVGAPLALAFSPNSKLLASAHYRYNPDYRASPSDRMQSINVWCIATGHKLKSCSTILDPLVLKKLAFSSNTELVVPTTKGLCRWRFQSSPGFDKNIPVSDIRRLSTIDFSPDMKFFATTDRLSNNISVWQLNSSDGSADALSGYGIPTYNIGFVTISSDASVAALSSSDASVALWRTDTGQRCQTFTGHTHRVTAITFTQDSSIMVTSDVKSILRFWQTATGECINVLSTLETSRAAESSNWYEQLSQIAVSADLGILACSSRAKIFVLRKIIGKEYECIVQYPAPKDDHGRPDIKHIAVSLNSVYISWGLSERPLDTEQNLLEHWRIDTNNPISLHVGNQHCSILYQEKNVGLVIPRGKDPLQVPSTNFAWITKNGEQLLWIPGEFRPFDEESWDFSGSILAIALNSDNLLIIDFSRQPNSVVCREGETKGLKKRRET